MAHFGMRKKGLDRFILAIASGRTVRAAAKAAGISERTARRHTADSVVQMRIAARRRQLVSRAVGRLSAGMTAAARELDRLLRDPSAKVRLGTARTILDFGARLRPDERTMTGHEVNLILDAMAKSIRRHVPDQQVLTAIQDDVRRVCNEVLAEK
jgi:hypothetical protein